MTNFEKITEAPEALGEFLASLPVATGLWDEEFHRMFCDSCELLECGTETCPHKGNRPLWWLAMGGKPGEAPGLSRPALWTRGRSFTSWAKRTARTERPSSPTGGAWKRGNHPGRRGRTAGPAGADVPHAGQRKPLLIPGPPALRDTLRGHIEHHYPPSSP